MTFTLLRHPNFMRLFFAVSIFFLLPYPLPAQIGDMMLDLRGKNGAQTVMGFLLLPTGAVETGSAQGSFAGSGCAADIPSYPSATASFKNVRVTLTHTEQVLGLRKEFAGVCFPVDQIGTIGWYSTFFTTGKWADSRTIDERISKVSAFDFAGGFSAARAMLGNRLHAGLSLSYAESHLDESVARGVLIAADTRFFPVIWGGLRLGISNAALPVSYGAEDEWLPLRGRASVSVTPLDLFVDLRDRVALDIAAGVSKSAAAPLLAGAAASIRLANLVDARFGWDYTLGGGDPIEGIALGAGLRWTSYRADFGCRIQSRDLGPLWSLSVNYNGDEILPQSARDFFDVAQRHFARGRYNRAISYARKALDRDPNLWQAHTLITRANAAMRRQEGLEVALLYTGGLRGAFLSASGASNDMGGLARQASVIRQIRSRYPVSFAVNTGNMVNRSTHPLKIGLAGAFLDSMRFDGVTAGNGELLAGLNPLLAAMGKGDLVCSGMPNAPDRRIVSASLMQKRGYTLALLSAVEPDSITDPAVRAQLGDPVALLKQQLDALAFKIADLRIATVHGSWDFVKLIARAVPSLDIILCGSLTQRFETPMRLDSTWVLSSGSLGRYAGKGVLRFNSKRKLLSVENQLIPLDESVVPDSSIDLLVRTITLQSQLSESGIDPAKLRRGEIDGVFCFVSDRTGTPNIYLKSMDAHAEFPLTQGQDECSSPQFHAKTGGLLYRSQVPGRQTTHWMFMYVDGTGLRKVTSSRGEVVGATLNHDGNWIYATVQLPDSTTDLVRLAVRGATEVTVAGWEGSSESEPSFSPDNISLAFVSDRDKTKRVFLSNLLGENPVAISPSQGNHFGPAFSHNGKYIAHLTDRTGSKDNYDLWIYNRESGKQLQITRNARIAHYRWVTDRILVYSSGINVLDYNIVNVESGESSKLVPASGDIKQWQEEGALVVPYKGTNRVAYTRRLSSGERVIAITDPDKSGDILLIDSKGNDWTE